MYQPLLLLGLGALSGVYANNAISESDFTDDFGIRAANAGAPMWHFASSSCLPSAAEDGQGQQTDGVDVKVVECAVNANLNDGCPGDSTYQGANVFYHGAAGEPFDVVPTYYATKNCDDGSWRTYYGVYFKKDVSHKSDWEYAILKWTQDDSGDWIRDSVSLEVDRGRGGGSYSGIPNTFDSSSDQFEDGNQGRDHPKFYFGKHHHAVHWDTSSNFKSTCGPGTDDFRANDFQFWSQSNLRHIDYIDQDWSYGAATNPHETVAGMCG